MKINWTTSAWLITILLIALAPSCLLAELYMWTDENDHPVVSSEKPPSHITEFQTIGQRDASQENNQPSSTSPIELYTTSQYDDFPALILEKIKHTARKKWPDSESAQEAMVHRQVRAYRYVLNALSLNIPVVVFDRIIEVVEHKWPNDYEQQAAYIRQQSQAYYAILDFGDTSLSGAVIDEIINSAADKWPYDYARQERFLRQEVGYYVEKGEPEPKEKVDGLRTYTIRSKNNEEL